MMRTVAEYELLEGADALTKAERALIAAVRAGQDCALSTTRPDTATDANTIRADLLALLITGGKEGDNLDPVGVTLVGGYITGTLTLTHRRAVGDTGLFKCHFESTPEMRGAKFTTLGLSGSHLPALAAQGINVEQSLFLRKARVTGTIHLNRAKIGGQLDCVEAELTASEGHALNAQGINVEQSLFLRKARVTGTIDLNSAKIGGQLDFEGAELTVPTGHALNAQGINVAQDLFLRGAMVTGSIVLGGAKIGGQMDCRGATFDGKGGNALNLQRATVIEALVWQRVTVTAGVVSLAAATVGDLCDDLTSWPKAHDPSLPSPQPKLDLDGFTYTRLIATTTRAKDRLPWLAAGSYWEGNFTPQPYTQLAKVLREIGHDREARVVLIERERRLAEHERLSQYRKRNGKYLFPLEKPLKDIAFILQWLWDIAFRWAIGYGYQPWRAAIALITLIALSSVTAQRAWDEGSFAPNSDVILMSQSWVDLTAQDCQPTSVGCTQNPAKDWSAKYASGMDWDSFYAVAYGVDLVLPLIDLGQNAAWAPSKDRGPWGLFLWWGRWVAVIFGWLFSALGAAALTGIMQRNRES